MSDCAAAGCAASSAQRCSYVDRRDRACPTAWCPRHAGVVDGRVYCRRHAGVVRALAGGSAGAPLPDLETRAPSLVEWVARDLDAAVRELLLATGAGDSVTSEPARPMHAARRRERTWERSWRLCRHTGVVHRVAIEVSEENDTEVVLRAGSREVARLTPPWIAARLRGEALDAAEDTARRAAFRLGLLGALRDALAAEALSRR